MSGVLDREPEPRRGENTTWLIAGGAAVAALSIYDFEYSHVMVPVPDILGLFVGVLAMYAGRQLSR